MTYRVPRPRPTPFTHFQGHYRPTCGEPASPSPCGGRGACLDNAVAEAVFARVGANSSTGVPGLHVPTECRPPSPLSKRGTADTVDTESLVPQPRRPRNFPTVCPDRSQPGDYPIFGRNIRITREPLASFLYNQYTQKWGIPQSSVAPLAGSAISAISNPAGCRPQRNRQRLHTIGVPA